MMKQVWCAIAEWANWARASGNGGGKRFPGPGWRCTRCGRIHQ